MIMAGVALLNTTPNPSTDDIVRALNGNVCRCGAYPQITDAVMSVLGTEQPLAVESPASEWVPGTVPA
jgi:xanthine dehydrogenase YagT iron-sulfur-binding subunit